MSSEEIVIKKGEDEYILSDKRLRNLASKFIEMAADEAAIHDDFGMSTKMIDTIVNVKKAFFPATQKNLNLNVENFDKKIEKFMKARKEMKEAQKEGLTVYEIKEDKDESNARTTKTGQEITK